MTYPHCPGQIVGEVIYNARGRLYPFLAEFPPVSSLGTALDSRDRPAPVEVETQTQAIISWNFLTFLEKEIWNGPGMSARNAPALDSYVLGTIPISCRPEIGRAHV